MTAVSDVPVTVLSPRLYPKGPNNRLVLIADVKIAHEITLHQVHLLQTSESHFKAKPAYIRAPSGQSVQSVHVPHDLWVAVRDALVHAYSTLVQEERISAA